MAERRNIYKEGDFLQGFTLTAEEAERLNEQFGYCSYEDHACERCGYNSGFDSHEGKKPCGQQNCWYELEAFKPDSHEHEYECECGEIVFEV